jgi:hypothetical protein
MPMLEIAQTYSKELAALAAVLITWALNRYARPRARLLYSVRHAWTTLVEEPLKDPEGKVLAERQAINTASLVINNDGRDTAKNVEIVFNWKPMFLNVWPARHFEEKASAHNRHSLFFQSLAPKEAINIELISINANLPAMVTVRSDEVTAQERGMMLQPIHPNWKLALFTWFFLAGIAATGYLVALLIQIIAA